MRDQLTESEVNTVCEGYVTDAQQHHYLPFQVAFAGMALLGMERHEKYTPDWLAHNALWAGACKQIGQIIEPTLSGIGIGAEADVLIEKIKAAARGAK